MEAQSGWSLYGVWWIASAVRQAHNRLIEKDERIAKLELELLEWENKTLSLANLKPLHYKPGPTPSPVSRAPIGPTMKRNMLAERAVDIEAKTRPSDEQILQAANQARSNGNGNK